MSRKIQAFFGQVELGLDPFRIIVRNVFGQPFGLNFFAAFQSNGTFDDVFKFANVAAPNIAFEKLHRLGRDRQRAAAH